MSDFDKGFERPKSGTWKPGKPGDVLKGTYVGKKPFEGDYGPTTIYQFKAIEGFYHDIAKDETVSASPTKLEAGTMYSVFERNTFADDMAQAKVGQKVILRFEEMKKPKTGGKPYKLVVALLGPMDAEFGDAFDKLLSADNPFDGK